VEGDNIDVFDEDTAADEDFAPEDQFDEFSGERRRL